MRYTQAWLRSIHKVPFGCISASNAWISLEIHTSQIPRMRYKWCKFAIRKLRRKLYFESKVIHLPYLGFNWTDFRKTSHLVLLTHPL